MTAAWPPVQRRVLLVHDYGGTRGGAELVIQGMRAALRARGIDARLLASTADPFDQASAPDWTFRGSTGRLRSLKETINLDAVRVARLVMRTFDPHVVHMGMILTQASPFVLPVFRQAAVVWVPNEFRPVCPKGTRLLSGGRDCSHPVGVACLRERCFTPIGLAPRLLQIGLLRWWQPAVDVVVSPSRAFADTLEAHGVHVDAIVPHGVVVPPFREPRCGGAMLACAGRLVREKGVHVLLDAVADLPDRWSHVRLRIAGDGPERATLERQARSLGIHDRIEFLGHLTNDDVQRQFAEAAIQVVPSLWAEPFGLVTVEAMARGTPVVASAVGAQPELIEDGRTGYLVPPGDAAWLARRLADVMDDPDGRATVAAAAWQHASANFSVDHMADQFVAIYNTLLLKAPSTA